MISPNASDEEKSRHLRALYRDKGGESAHAIVKAEYERLYPDGGARLDQILVSAWTEGRELAGQRYDRVAQCWRDAKGNRVD